MFTGLNSNILAAGIMIASRMILNPLFFVPVNASKENARSYLRGLPRPKFCPLLGSRLGPEQLATHCAGMDL
jgi:hypothetical protein